jgi:hypothetical protein
MRIHLILLALSVHATAPFGDREKTHMKQIHGITDFTPESFFQLHDLNSNHFLDDGELKHFYNTYAHANDLTLKDWLASVHKVVDLNKDGKLSFEEVKRPAFEDRVFSTDGQGDGMGAFGSAGTSAWTATNRNKKVKNGKVVYTYHNVPAKYRLSDEL